MGNVIAIISSKNVLSPEELIEVVLKAGGYKDPDGVTGHMGNSGHIWIFSDDSILQCILIENPEEFAQIAEKLGGKPQISIGVEIDSAPESHKLAIDFAYMCAETWPCVVDTLEKQFRIFSREEIMQIRNKGKTFADYE